MKRINFFFLCILFAIPVNLDAQDDEDDYNEEEDSYEHVTYSRKKGIMFGLNVGLLLANNKPAEFYNGTAPNDVMPFLFNTNSNSYNAIVDYLGTPNFTLVELPAPPTEMNYAPAINLGLNLRYQFNWENAIVTDFNFSNLQASGAIGLQINNPDPTGPSTVIRNLSIYGKEQRLTISLGYQATLSQPSAMGFIFEAGPLLTSVKATRNAFVVGDREFNILRAQIVNGNQFINNRQQTTNDFGAYVAFGTNIEFDKFTVDALFRSSYEKVQFDQDVETKHKFNFLPQLRFTYRIIK